MNKRNVSNRLAEIVEELQSVDIDKKEALEAVDIKKVLDSIFEEQHILEACLEGCIARIEESSNENIANGLRIQWYRFKKLIDQTTDVLWEQNKKDSSR